MAQSIMSDARIDSFSNVAANLFSLRTRGRTLHIGIESNRNAAHAPLNAAFPNPSLVIQRHAQSETTNLIVAQKLLERLCTMNAVIIGKTRPCCNDIC